MLITAVQEQQEIIEAQELQISQLKEELSKAAKIQDEMKAELGEIKDLLMKGNF